MRSSVSLVFFKGEVGIRDLTVTGVQTCALPISTCRTTVRRGSTARQRTPSRFWARLRKPGGATGVEIDALRTPIAPLALVRAAHPTGGRRLRTGVASAAHVDCGWPGRCAAPAPATGSAGTRQNPAYRVAGQWPGPCS